MPAELVVDASTGAKWFFAEPGSEVVKALIEQDAFLIAPDLILVEIASVAAKKVRRNEMEAELGAAALRELPELLDEVVPASGLCGRALDFACLNGFSVYDGVYLALAEQRRSQVVTADARLVRRAQGTPCQDLVRLLVD